MKSIFSLCSVVCLALLACGGPEEPWPEPGDTLEAVSEGLVSTQGSQVQGSQVQGSQVQGSQLASVSVSGGSLNGVALEGVKVVKGGLTALRRTSISGRTSSLSVCATPQSGLQRSCGFTSYGVGRCTPTTPVFLGGGAGGYGRCSGNPMLRVCSGNTPCEENGVGYITSGDDTGASLCPSVSFKCPASGVYNVLAGAFSSTDTFIMRVADNQEQFPAKETLNNTMLQGAMLMGTTALGDSVNLRIALVKPAPWNGDTWLYSVTYQGPGNNNTPLCADIDNEAVVVAGVFNEDGTYDHGNINRFTFACSSGVANKCYRWGYQPWKPSRYEDPNDPNHGSHDPDEMEKVYWTCTRMARADYCGDGGSFTKDGTRINLWDDLGIQKKDVTTDLKFEAGWNTKGAVCLSHERWQSLRFNPNLCASGKLYAPKYLDGLEEAVNICDDPNESYVLVNGHLHYYDENEYLQPCASVCEQAYDGDLIFDQSVNLYNESNPNNY